jgi:hypothetical protein
MFTVLTITCLGARIGYLYMFKQMEVEKIKKTYPFYSKWKFIPFMLAFPFIVMSAFKFALFLQSSVLPLLRLTGIYF